MKNKQKYPVGTAIRYNGYCSKCKGKTGKIVDISKYTCNIILPSSTCSIFECNGFAVCPWEDIIPISVKNQQLLFDFMEE